MSQLTLVGVASSTIGTPASGKLAAFMDSTSKLPGYKNDAGRFLMQSDNAAIAGITVNAADTYVTDSDLLIPSFGMQTRAKFEWKISVSKTAAGVATPIYNIRIGTLRTVAGDTARLVLTGPAQTAIADVGTLNIMVTVRAVSATVGVIQGTAWWDHRGTAASSTIGVGFANDGTGHVEGTSSNFDNSALGASYIGISLNSGASGVWTTTQAWASAKW